MDLGLQGKQALITGGSRGIGFAIAKGLAKEGVDIAICARNKTEVVKAVKEIETKYDVKTLGVNTDVTKEKDIRELVLTVNKAFNGVDILINNAGMGSEEKIIEAKDEKWQYYWDLHVMSAVRLSRHLIPFMKKRGGGVIINNASICAKQPQFYEPIYNVTKAALAMFSKCLSNEVIGDNIRVNCVNPGLILTPDWKRTAAILGEKIGISADEYLSKIAKESAPIGRFADTKELANFFVFLCSSCASYCVGSSYYVDGGMLQVVT